MESPDPPEIQTSGVNFWAFGTRDFQWEFIFIASRFYSRPGAITRNNERPNLPVFCLKERNRLFV